MLVFNLKLMYPTGDSDKNLMKKKKEEEGNRSSWEEFELSGNSSGSGAASSRVTGHLHLLVQVTRELECLCICCRTCSWLVEFRMRAHRSARSPVGQPRLLYCWAAALSCPTTTTQNAIENKQECKKRREPTLCAVKLLLKWGINPFRIKQISLKQQIEMAFIHPKAFHIFTNTILHISYRATFDCNQAVNPLVGAKIYSLQNSSNSDWMRNICERQFLGLAPDSQPVLWMGQSSTWNLTWVKIIAGRWIHSPPSGSLFLL